MPLLELASSRQRLKLPEELALNLPLTRMLSIPEHTSRRNGDPKLLHNWLK